MKIQVGIISSLVFTCFSVAALPGSKPLVYFQAKPTIAIENVKNEYQKLEAAPARALLGLSGPKAYELAIVILTVKETVSQYKAEYHLATTRSAAALGRCWYQLNMAQGITFLSLHEIEDFITVIFHMLNEQASDVPELTAALRSLDDAVLRLEYNKLIESAKDLEITIDIPSYNDMQWFIRLMVVASQSPELNQKLTKKMQEKIEWCKKRYAIVFDCQAIADFINEQCNTHYTADSVAMRLKLPW